MSSGASGVGCAAGPTRRTVFDKAAVPAMRNADGTTPEFGFIVDDSGHDWYTMAVMNPRNLEEGDVSSACTWMVMGNSGAEASVIFNEPPFASRAAAKAWMATEQYAQLKALLMSLSYS
ncbi:hypothetical protein [Arthrobacter sp. MMS18-M83]|uniref:hypothetical protein n=1 Tax=Arthrobacter sp. MMS18-M83 TaxID=2996261 RepID=UPI00227D5681|nr:hypothetical protein [Arthrobacter sp. MMS18-M83]WAH96741.1 hypothetical protein OW521_20540 [Arthrobacter sp. MMS18-M83]